MRRIKQAFDCEISYTFFVLLTKPVMVYVQHVYGFSLPKELDLWIHDELWF